MYTLAGLYALLFVLPVITIVTAAPPNHSSRRPIVHTASRSFWTTIKTALPESLLSRLNPKYSIAYKPYTPQPFRPESSFFGQYDDQLVLRFNISSIQEAQSLAEACNVLFLDIWGQANEWVDVRLAHDVIPSLLGLLPESLQHSHIPLLSSRDLTRAIADTFPTGPSKRPRRRFNTQTSEDDPSSFFDDYRSLEDIESWMTSISSKFPSLATNIAVGSTFNGRDISGLLVSVRDPSTPATSSFKKRETILVTGGQHAREWVSTSTVNYIANAFITSYGSDPLVTTLLDALDFVFVPTLNPDGYQYTWSYDRLWRKNRQPTNLPFCQGIDLDRSWDFMWDGQRTIDNPCSESYAGETPFTATESRTFAEWAKNQTNNNHVSFVGLIDLHSYSQQILYPYSFSCKAQPPTLEDLQELGHGLAKSIRIASRETYSVLSACEGNVATSGEVFPRLEGGGGSLLDWFYSELHVRKAYQIKLRDNGSYGFLLPREDILPTGEEIYYLVRHFAKLLAMPDSTAASEAPNRAGETQELLSDKGASPKLWNDL